MEHRLSHPIHLVDAGGAAVPASLECRTRAWVDGGYSRRVCSIDLRCARCAVAGEGHDFFEAFCRVREALEPAGLVPRCYGASRNVFPSGMARDTGQGLRAYRLRLGEDARGNCRHLRRGPRRGADERRGATGVLDGVAAIARHGEPGIVKEGRRTGGGVVALRRAG